MDELGIEPSPELQRLNASILRQEVSLQPRTGGSGPGPLRGRVRARSSGGWSRFSARAPSRPAPRISSHLREGFDYADSPGDLTRVSQYVAAMKGEGPLYDALHDLYDADLARVGSTVSSRRCRRTCASVDSAAAPRDDELRHGARAAFEEAGESFEIVSYLAAGRHRGRFCHIAADGNDG